jgi:RNA polymerase sigma factor FliA
MTEAVAIWRGISEPKSERQRLIEQYAPLARHVVERLHLRLSASVSQDDLISAATIGLIEAVDNYDANRGVKFESFAYHRIRGAVMDLLRQMDWLPRSMRQKERQVSGAIENLEAQLGRMPTEVELAEEVGVDVSAVGELLAVSRLSVQQSLNEFVLTGEGEATEALELVADEGESPEQTILEQEKRRLLAEAVGNLPEKERMVMALYYQEGLTLKEIGAVLGVTESWICQLHTRALQRLRTTLSD